MKNMGTYKLIAFNYAKLFSLASSWLKSISVLKLSFHSQMGRIFTYVFLFLCYYEYIYIYIYIVKVMVFPVLM